MSAGETLDGWVLGGDLPPDVEWFEDPRVERWREICGSRGLMGLRAGRLPDGREVLFWWETDERAISAGSGFVGSNLLDMWLYLKDWVEEQPLASRDAHVPSGPADA